MDLNLNALIGMTYLIPIAITLRKVYAPSFDIPKPIAIELAKLDAGFIPHRAAFAFPSAARVRRMQT